jgi:hypothetical protein
MLYSGTMNRMLIVAVVACVILFVLAVLIAPTIDLEPSALRAQQWLTLIAAMFSLVGFFGTCLQIMRFPATISRCVGVGEYPQRISSLDLSCPLLC